MPLEISQIKERVENPQNKELIQQAIRHERKLRFHTVPTVSNIGNKQAEADYFKWVESLLPEAKVQTHRDLFTYPVRTVPLTQQVFAVYEKAFEGRNPVFKYNFRTPEAEEQWQDYRRNYLRGNKRWKEDGMEVLKGRINCIVIVDLPREPNLTGRPAAYWWRLRVEDLVDFQLTSDGSTFEWVIFRNGENELAAYDDEYYRIFKFEDQQIGALISESTHDLNYCPARTYWSRAMDIEKPFLKEAPLTPELSNMDKLLFAILGKEHLDMYASHPIYALFREDCDYELVDQGIRKQYCDKGLLRDSRHVYISRGGLPVKCPACSARKLHGPGSVIKVDPPTKDNDKADLRNPVQVIGVDRASLDYNVEHEDRLWESVYNRMTGYSGETPNDQAVNMKHIQALFQSREDKINSIQGPLEEIQAWTESTICRLMFGDFFTDLSVSYGTEHYLWTAEELLEFYNISKKAGLSDIILDMIQDQYYDTKYRNNQEQLDRITVLKNVEPFRHLSKSEVSAMRGIGLVEDRDVLVKLNFSEYILRFERENIPVQDFGPQRPLKDRVDQIREAIYSYITIPENPPQTADTSVQTS